MIYRKQHENYNGDLIISLCDKTCFGKKFKEGKKVLDATSDFFGDEKIDEPDFEKALKEATSIYAIGKESTDLLLKKGIITKDNILTIKNIPYMIVCLSK
jgi:hypothetical protein